MSTTPLPIPAPRPHLDPRLPSLTEQVLTATAADLDESAETLDQIAHHVRAVTAAHEITDPALIEQVRAACHAAISLVFVVDHEQPVVDDPGDAWDSAKTTAGIIPLLARHHHRLHPLLLERAARLVAAHARAAEVSRAVHAGSRPLTEGL